MSMSDAELKLSRNPSQLEIRARTREIRWIYSRAERFRFDFFEDDLDLRFPVPSASASRSSSISILIERD